MKCVIIASGMVDCTEAVIREIQTCDLVICADGGAVHLRKMGLTPHVMIGDFDSILDEDKNFFQDQGTKTITFPAKKDKTDSHLCIDYAIAQKVSDITLLGFTGSRIDHTLANILLLTSLADKHISTRIIDSNNEIHLVTSQISLKGTPGDYLSLIPISNQVTGITLEGLAYPLKNAVLNRGSTRGVSNYFTEKQAEIRIDTGVLIVTISKDQVADPV